MNRPSPTQIGSLILVAGLAGLARAAAADPIPPLRIVLHSSKDGSIPPNVVTRAKAEMTRIYRHDGVKILWVEPAPTIISPEAQTPQTTSAPQLTLIILSREMTDQLTVASTALGATPSTREYRGRMAYVFYNRVEGIARAYLTTVRGRAKHNGDTDNVIVLAHAMAHESGHLLLPYGHSVTGLMRHDWDGEDLHRAARGQLQFTTDEAELIRTKLLTFTSESMSASSRSRPPQAQRDLATAQTNVRLILVVHDEVDVPAQLLQDARGVAAKIFRHAGVDIVWFAARDAIPQVPVAAETISEWEFRNALYVVRIATGAAGRSPSSALGFTVPGTRTTTVVYSHVEQVARSSRDDVALILGHVMAHELGHLLLRRSAHSTGGLMHATLDVQRAARGVLLFTDAEEEAIRASLSASASRASGLP